MVGFAVYIIHLGVVLCLFLTLPYSKFAHILYRTLAMVHRTLDDPRADDRTSNVKQRLGRGSETNKEIFEMIKPHGSDTLNPLYVADDAKRAALLEGGRRACQSIVVCSAGRRQRGDDGLRLLQPAHRLHEPGRRHGASPRR